MNSENQDNFDWDAEWEALDAAKDPDLIHHLAPTTQRSVNTFLTVWQKFYLKSAQLRRVTAQE